MVKPENNESPNPTGATEDELGFSAYEERAKSSSAYMKKGVLYLINYSMKPQEQEVVSDFKNKDGSAKMVKQYRIQVINSEGLPEFVIVSSKIYLEIIKMHDTIEAMQAAMKSVKIFPYVRVS
jgi:hypothetical protein